MPDFRLRRVASRTWTSTTRVQFLLIGAIVLASHTEQVSGDYSSLRLIKNIFPKVNLILAYGPNPLIRPVSNYSDPLVVSLGLTVMSVVDLNFVEHSMTSYVWVSMEWTDPNLAWDAKEYDGVDSISVPTSLIFTPDITVYNDLSGDVGLPKDKVLAFVRSNGHVNWIVPAILKTSCNTLKLESQRQTCPIKFGSWIHDASKIELRVIGAALESESEQEVNGNVNQTKNTTTTTSAPIPVPVTADISSVVHPVAGEWKLVQATGVRNVIHYACCPEPYNDVTFTLEFVRAGAGIGSTDNAQTEAPVAEEPVSVTAPKSAPGTGSASATGIWSRLPSWQNIVG